MSFERFFRNRAAKMFLPQSHSRNKNARINTLMNIFWSLFQYYYCQNPKQSMLLPLGFKGIAQVNVFVANDTLYKYVSHKYLCSNTGNVPRNLTELSWLFQIPGMGCTKGHENRVDHFAKSAVESGRCALGFGRKWISKEPSPFNGTFCTNEEGTRPTWFWLGVDPIPRVVESFTAGDCGAESFQMRKDCWSLP